jgi:hypothetical protein
MRTEIVRVALSRPWRVLGWAVVPVLAGCGGSEPAFETPAPPRAQTVQAAARVPQDADTAATPAPVAAPAPALAIRRQPRDVEARAGSIVLLDVGVEVDAAAPAAVTYQWLRDGAPIDGETEPSLQLVLMPADHLARISVLVKAGRDTLRSDSALLRIGRL